MAEFGFYAKGYTSGAAVGYDSVNGFTVSVFESVSAGASADFWSSWNVTFGHGIRWEGVTPYTGIGVPIGTPTPISGTLQTNMITGDIFGTIGRPFSGRAGIMEGGVYGEMSPFSFPEQSTHEPDPYASGNPHPNFDENGYWSAPTLDNDAQSGSGTSAGQQADDQAAEQEDQNDSGAADSTDNDAQSSTSAGEQSDAQAAEGVDQYGGTTSTDNDGQTDSGTSAGEQSDAQAAETESQYDGTTSTNSGDDARGTDTERGENNAGYGIQPIVIDLDGDGADLIEQGSSTAFVDVNGDGFKQQVGWVAASDGLLTVDRNNNSRVDEIGEFAFATLTADNDTDLEAFRSIYDTNDDGVFNSDDEAWNDAGIWRDHNQNGTQDEGELKSLDDMGISSINLISDGIQDTRADGSLIHGSAEFAYQDGTTGRVYDSTFAASDIGIRELANGMEANFADASKAFFAKDGQTLSMTASSEGYDAIFAGAGNDQLISGRDTDVLLSGGDGNDTIIGGSVFIIAGKASSRNHLSKCDTLCFRQ